MLEIKTKRIVEWPVKIKQPVDGGTQDVLIKVRYALLTKSEQRTVLSKLQELAKDGDLDAAVSYTTDVLKANIKGWSGDIDEPFSEAALSQALDISYIADAMEKGLFDASRGAVAKN